MSVRRRSIVYSGAVPSVVYTDNELQASATTHTYTAKSIGPAKGTRTVLVAWYHSSASTPAMSMTINGVAAAQVVNADVTTDHFRVFALNVPTGTTADIVATASVAGISFIVVYAAYDLLSTTPTDKNSGVTATASLSLPLNVAANGIAIGYGTINGTSTFTWTGLTWQFDATAVSNSQTGATYTATAAQSPLAVTVNRSSNGIRGFVASFR